MGWWQRPWEAGSSGHHASRVADRTPYVDRRMSAHAVVERTDRGTHWSSMEGASWMGLRTVRTRCSHRSVDALSVERTGRMLNHHTHGLGSHTVGTGVSVEVRSVSVPVSVIVLVSRLVATSVLISVILISLLVCTFPDRVLVSVPASVS